MHRILAQSSSCDEEVEPSNTNEGYSPRLHEDDDEWEEVRTNGETDNEVEGVHASNRRYPIKKTHTPNHMPIICRIICQVKCKIT